MVKRRKVKPSVPKWFWFDVDGCWFCHNQNNCGNCKVAKKTAKGRKKRDMQHIADKSLYSVQSAVLYQLCRTQ